MAAGNRLHLHCDGTRESGLSHGPVPPGRQPDFNSLEKRLHNEPLKNQAECPTKEECILYGTINSLENSNLSTCQKAEQWSLEVGRKGRGIIKGQKEVFLSDTMLIILILSHRAPSKDRTYQVAHFKYVQLMIACQLHLSKAV